VGQTGPAELLGQHGIHGAGVADGEARDETRGTGIEHPPSGREEAGADRAGHLLGPARPTDRSRRTTGGQHRDQRLPVPRWGDADLRADHLPRQQVGPLLRREDDGCVVDVVPSTGVQQLGHRRVHDHPRPSATRQGIRISVQFEDHRGGAPRVGDEAQG
jgi:hypothetical protein